MSKDKDDEYKNEFAKQNSIGEFFPSNSPKGRIVEEQKQLKFAVGKRTKRTSITHKKRLSKAFKSLAEEMDNFLSNFNFKRVLTKTPEHHSWGDALYIKMNKINSV